MMMDWFRPHAIDLTDLEPFGVTQRSPNGSPYAVVDEASGAVLVQVGDVTVYERDRVIVWPRVGLGARARAALLTTAEDALRGKVRDWDLRTTASGATYRAVGVFVPVADGHLLSIALRAVGEAGDMASEEPRAAEQDATAGARP